MIPALLAQLLNTLAAGPLVEVTFITAMFEIVSLKHNRKYHLLRRLMMSRVSDGGALHWGAGGAELLWRVHLRGEEGPEDRGRRGGDGEMLLLRPPLPRWAPGLGLLSSTLTRMMVRILGGAGPPWWRMDGCSLLPTVWRTHHPTPSPW